MGKKANTSARKPEAVVDPHPGKHWVLWMNGQFKKRMRLVAK